MSNAQSNMAESAVIRVSEVKKSTPMLEQQFGALREHGNLSSRNMSIIKEFISILKPFQEAADNVQKRILKHCDHQFLVLSTCVRNESI